MTAVLGDAAAAARTRIKLVFLLHAIATGSLFTRIPDLQQGLGIDAGTLGLAFIGQPVGAIAMFLVSSRIVEHSGTRLVLLVGLPLLATGILLMALAPSALGLFLAIAGFSAAFALTNVALNVEADRVEAATERRLMNTCHGLWSLGQLLVFLVGVAARGLQIPPAAHFGAVLPLIVVGTLLVVLPLRPAAPRDHRAGAALRRRLALPSVATLRLLGVILAGGLVEAATRNWSVIFARDSFAEPAWADALTLPVFVAAVALGRFGADGLTARLGAARLGRRLLALALVGLGVVVFAPTLPVALVGFALMGLGICTAFPASTSAAAQLGDRPSSENVAALTLSSTIAMLAAPPLMGFVADTLGIRMTFAGIAPMLVVAIFVAGALTPRPSPA